MGKMINKEQAIQALVEGKTVEFRNSGYLYKVQDGRLGGNAKNMGFVSTDHDYNVVPDFVGKLYFEQCPSFHLVADRIASILKDKQALKKPVTGKTIKQNLIQALSDAFGVRDQVFKVEPVQLFRLGDFGLPVKGTNEDLSEYFIDADGDMYSKNDDTYFTKFGMVLTKLSNGALDASGNIVNSFRAKSGNKVTIARKKLIKLRDAGLLEDVTMLPKSVHMVHVPSGEEIATEAFVG